VCGAPHARVEHPRVGKRRNDCPRGARDLTARRVVGRPLHKTKPTPTASHRRATLLCPHHLRRNADRTLRQDVACRRGARSSSAPHPRGALRMACGSRCDGVCEGGRTAAADRRAAPAAAGVGAGDGCVAGSEKASVEVSVEAGFTTLSVGGRRWGRRETAVWLAPWRCWWRSAWEWASRLSLGCSGGRRSGAGGGALTVRDGARVQVLSARHARSTVAAASPRAGSREQAWVTLRARWVTLRARWVTLRARWVTLRARWVTLRAH
jgi:hypothetical protein